jgi:hypothetical protein
MKANNIGIIKEVEESKESRSSSDMISGAHSSEHNIFMGDPEAMGLVEETINRLKMQQAD